MRMRGKLYAAVMAAVMTALCAAPVLAASSDRISTIRLELKDNLTRGGAIDGDELEFSVTSGQYEITEWEIENSGILWEEADVPQVKVRLETEDNHYFSVSRDNIRVKGDEAKVYSTNRVNSQCLEIIFELKPMSQRVGPIEYAYLQDRTATWSAAPGAVSYDIYLYRDSKAVGSKKNTTELTYDFGTAMLKEGNYYYRVRGVGAEGAKPGLFLESEEFYRSPDDEAGSKQSGNSGNSAAVPAGSWQKNEIGKWWQRADGTWPANQWELIGGQWFFFNQSGYVVTGWVDWNGHSYYCGPEGDMWVNRQTPEGYQLNSEGMKIER